MFNKDFWIDFLIRLRDPSIENYKEKIKNYINRKAQISDKPRVFIAVKNVNWEKAGLVDSWESLAEIIHFDWGEKFDQYIPEWHDEIKYKFNRELLNLLIAENMKKPIQIFFSYLSGRLIFPETIEKINALGIITINISFDDSIKFWGHKEKTGWSGNADIAPVFDFCLTCQNERDMLKYQWVGARAFFIPPGGNPDVFAKAVSGVTQSIPLSFIGQNYGRRSQMVAFINSKGLSVYTRGEGWPDGAASQTEMIEIYQNSLITLGFGYLGNSRRTGLKGRDFEVPLTGTAYLTTYNESLSKCFKEDREIIFYRSSTELLQKIKYYLKNPEKAIEIGQAGKKRAMDHHTWQKRWKQILDFCR
jgi:glycosyltransferase involved in cell wall biosynthesis